MFFSYVKSIRRVLGTLFLFACIFGVVFYLYRLPMEAVGYAVLLCAAVGLCILLCGYALFARKHKALVRLTKVIDVSLSSLPAPDGLLEKDYQALLAQLKNAQLESRNKAEEKYADLMSYYTLWAHQIKTPIAAMSLLLQEQDIPKSREMAEELQKINHYVEMVLCYLRMDSESTDYVIRPCQLDDIIRQAVRKNASQFIRRKLKLVYVPVNVTVRTDEKWLLFVIEQVLGNALKYTPSGTVTIAMEAKDTLVIRDTGIGIAPEDLPRVCEKGYTGLNGRTDKKASGIGLYLCKRILTNLGHTISLSSRPGQGTAVHIGLGQSDTRPE